MVVCLFPFQIDRIDHQSDCSSPLQLGRLTHYAFDAVLSTSPHLTQIMERTVEEKTGR